MYKIYFASSAAKEFKKLLSDVQAKIESRIDRLEKEPRPQSGKKLSMHENIYRIRVGDYRVVYEINDKERIILITRIRHRKDVYRS